MSEILRATSTETKVTKPSFVSRTTCSVSDHSNLQFINYKFCGISNPNRITNGEEAEKNEFPWLGLLKFRSTDKETFETFMCSCSLISPRYVLTGIFVI